jgi:hypothetical protein
MEAHVLVNKLTFEQHSDRQWEENTFTPDAQNFSTINVFVFFFIMVKVRLQSKWITSTARVGDFINSNSYASENINKNKEGQEQEKEKFQ